VARATSDRVPGSRLDGGPTGVVSATSDRVRESWLDGAPTGVVIATSDRVPSLGSMAGRQVW
jgi:hypothetical protein